MLSAVCTSNNDCNIEIGFFNLYSIHSFVSLEGMLTIIVERPSRKITCGTQALAELPKVSDRWEHSLLILGDRDNNVQN